MFPNDTTPLDNDEISKLTHKNRFTFHKTAQNHTEYNFNSIIWCNLHDVYSTRISHS